MLGFASLLSKEIEQRTLYMIISRPMSRTSFLLGKIIGLSIVLLINSLFLGLLTMLLYKFHGGEIQTLFYWSILFSFFEAFIMLLFSVLFSLITNTTLSVVYSILIFIVGHALNETSQISFTKISPLFNKIVSVTNTLLPNFYRINIKDFLIYNQTIELTYLLKTQLYIIFYVISLLCLITFLFKNKNLD
jgi:ABC-type transport system involved in multi-copper enzyme maturation permease subunit